VEAALQAACEGGVAEGGVVEAALQAACEGGVAEGGVAEAALQAACEGGAYAGGAILGESLVQILNQLARRPRRLVSVDNDLEILTRAGRVAVSE